MQVGHMSFASFLVQTRQTELASGNLLMHVSRMKFEYRWGEIQVFESEIISCSVFTDHRLPNA